MSESYTPQPGNGSAGAQSFTCSDFNPEAWRSSATLPDSAVRTRKVAIVGFGRTAKDAPWTDTSWEVWAMNGFWRCAKPDFGVDVPEERYSLWFDMHSVAYTREYGKVAGFEDKQERWLEQAHPFPVFMLDEDPLFPSVRRFPIEALIQALGRDYFTSTIAYAIAFALAQPDVAEIGLWGIDLVHDTEYAQQRPCAEYWIGRAEAMGIKVSPFESALLRQRHRYGYDAENELLRDMRGLLGEQVESLEKMIAKNNTELDKLRGQLHTDDGALQACKGVLQRLQIFERGGKV